MLTNSKAFYEREQKRIADAIVIEDGDLVKIEGIEGLCRVRVMRGNAGKFPQNSDPIYFDAMVRQ